MTTTEFKLLREIAELPDECIGMGLKTLIYIIKKGKPLLSITLTWPDGTETVYTKLKKPTPRRTVDIPRPD
jgi:hypothetical protein